MKFICRLLGHPLVCDAKQVGTYFARYFKVCYCGEHDSWDSVRWVKLPKDLGVEGRKA